MQQMSFVIIWRTFDSSSTFIKITDQTSAFLDYQPECRWCKNPICIISIAFFFWQKDTPKSFFSIWFSHVVPISKIVFTFLLPSFIKAHLATSLFLWKPEFISHNYDFLTHNCEFISCNSEKKWHNCNVMLIYAKTRLSYTVMQSSKLRIAVTVADVSRREDACFCCIPVTSSWVFLCLLLFQC